MSECISIIIPTFNRAHTLKSAIDSVLNQAADNWELIIVDDGSVDDTKQLVRKYLQDQQVKYVFQEHLGVSSARNRGVEISKGSYLVFLDSDDVLLPNLINRLNEISLSNYDFICWQVLKKLDGRSLIWKAQKLENVYNNLTATFLSGSICYKKEVFLEAGRFDEKMNFGENYELGLRIANLKNLNFKILNEVFLEYRLENKKRTSNSLTNQLNSKEYLLAKHQKKYKKDFYAHSKLQYQLGYLYEKTGQIKLAKEFYYKASTIRPVYLKALIKNLIMLFK